MGHTLTVLYQKTSARKNITIFDKYFFGLAFCATIEYSIVMTIDHIAIGARMGELRRRKGFDQSELGALLSPAKNFKCISSYEAGRHRLSVEIMFQVCQRLETTPAWLVFGKEPRETISLDEERFIVALRDAAPMERAALTTMLSTFERHPPLPVAKQPQFQRDLELRRLLAGVDRVGDGLKTDDVAQGVLQAIELLLSTLIDPPTFGPVAIETSGSGPAPVFGASGGSPRGGAGRRLA